MVDVMGRDEANYAGCRYSCSLTIAAAVAAMVLQDCSNWNHVAATSKDRGALRLQLFGCCLLPEDSKDAPEKETATPQHYRCPASQPLLSNIIHDHKPPI